MRRAKKHGITVAARERSARRDADERAHDDLADLALELEHAKHLGAIERGTTSPSSSARIRTNTTPPGEQVGFSGVPRGE